MNAVGITADDEEDDFASTVALVSLASLPC